MCGPRIIDPPAHTPITFGQFSPRTAIRIVSPWITRARGRDGGVETLVSAGRPVRSFDSARPLAKRMAAYPILQFTLTTQTCRSSFFEAAIRPSNRRDGIGRSIRRSVFGCLSGSFEVGPVSEGRMAPVGHRPGAAGDRYISLAGR